jgi:RNA polymerase sigma-70 factor, ECF subfamily
MPVSLLQRSGWSFEGNRMPSAPMPSLASREAPEEAVQAHPHGSRASQPSPPTDLERVGREARGEPEAQAWLLEQVMPRVRRVTRAFLKSPADADDAAQLALLAILRSAASYRGEANLGAWAKRIAVRTTLRFVAGERRTPSAPAPTEEEELEAPDDGRPCEALARDVREYLDELPEAQRNAVILHHALGYSIDEIAASTEVSPDTVKGRLKLGTAALRKRIRQEIAIGRRRQA